MLTGCINRGVCGRDMGTVNLRNEAEGQESVSSEGVGGDCILIPYICVLPP